MSAHSPVYGNPSRWPKSVNACSQTIGSSRDWWHVKSYVAAVRILRAEIENISCGNAMNMPKISKFSQRLVTRRDQPDGNTNPAKDQCEGRCEGGLWKERHVPSSLILGTRSALCPTRRWLLDIQSAWQKRFPWWLTKVSSASAENKADGGGLASHGLDLSRH